MATFMCVCMTQEDYELHFHPLIGTNITQYNSLMVSGVVPALTWALTHCCALLLQLEINVNYYTEHQNPLCVIHTIDTNWIQRFSDGHLHLTEGVGSRQS